MKESENITQTEENPKAGSAIHSQDGFKNQTEESREDKSFSFSAPQRQVPRFQTMRHRWHELGRTCLREHFQVAGCILTPDAPKKKGCSGLQLLYYMSLLMTLGSSNTCCKLITNWNTVHC